MNIALDKNGERISPTPKARAICQVCRDELVAHCGDIYTWHWQHRNDGNCDPWKEHETEWHRTWKSRFPKDWQEVAITNEDGERHLADIRTPEEPRYRISKLVYLYSDCGGKGKNSTII